MDKTFSKTFFGEILRAVVISVISVLTGILIFSVVVKTALLNGEIIKTVNQFIKTISIFLGCFFAIKKDKGLIKGIIVGVVFTIVVYTLFAIMGSGFSLGGAFFIDLAFCIAIGLISGVIAVNLRKKD